MWTTYLAARPAQQGQIGLPPGLVGGGGKFGVRFTHMSFECRSLTKSLLLRFVGVAVCCLKAAIRGSCITS